MKSPLMVLVLRLGDPAESETYAGALRDVFVGSESGGGTSFGPKELLQAGEFRELTVTGDPAAAVQALDFLDSADRLLAIALDARVSAPPARGVNTSLEQALVDAVLDAALDRAIVLSVSLKHAGSLHDVAGESPGVLRLGLEDLEERDLRLPFLTLYALHHALRLFAAPSSGGAGKAARLFLSHAKRDGVPLTKAFRGFMTELKGFDSFYDTNDLDLNGDIDLQLSTAVASAVVIVFRSDVFDQRYWCQKEVLWAEQHGRPVITVDARWHIEHAPSLVSFDSTPVVRIPDGNVIRICMTALIEALRVALFDERADAHATALGVLKYNIPRCPSLVSLHQACADLKRQRQASSGPEAYVVYPNPSLPTAMAAAAEGLAQFAVDRCHVVSLDEFRLLA